MLGPVGGLVEPLAQHLTKSGQNFAGLKPGLQPKSALPREGKNDQTKRPSENPTPNLSDGLKKQKTFPHYQT
ncbi:hypothetical protein EGS38_03670 [Neisseria chenwenguii]|nr:hypothetical protein EGS38_03670 [Neisseria chenwenguii]